MPITLGERSQVESIPPFLRLLLLSRLSLRLVLSGRCLLADERLKLHWRLAAHLTGLFAPETMLFCVSTCDHKHVTNDVSCGGH